MFPGIHYSSADVTVDGWTWQSGKSTTVEFGQEEAQPLVSGPCFGLPNNAYVFDGKGFGEAAECPSVPNPPALPRLYEPYASYYGPLFIAHGSAPYAGGQMYGDVAYRGWASHETSQVTDISIDDLSSALYNEYVNYPDADLCVLEESPTQVSGMPKYEPLQEHSLFGSSASSPSTARNERAKAMAAPSGFEVQTTRGPVMYSVTTGQPLGISTLSLPTAVCAKKCFKRSTSVACLFCRKRKIACGGPQQGALDRTCPQCARRHQKCEYPPAPQRGIRFKDPQCDDDKTIVFAPPIVAD